MKLRAAASVTLLALIAGCSSGGAGRPGDPPGATEVSAQTLTVSYRNHVRLPKQGEILTAEAFASQIHTRDPVASIRCAAEEASSFRDISSFLGGISWSHPVAIIKDATFPPLYDARRDFTASAPNAGEASDAKSSASPVISRPDLVGVQNGIAVFLSKQHGLMAVDTRTGAPLLSCSMKLPGQPQNFLFHGNELVVVVNAGGYANRSALLRYSFGGGTFRFVDAVRLEDQTITDARLFDSTIVAYTSWSKPVPPTPTPTPVQAGGGAPTSGGGADRASPIGGYYPGRDSNHLGSKLIVVKWDDALAIDFQDALLDDPAKLDPLEGKDPATKYVAGQLMSETKTYKSFVTASDRYIVVPRDVQKTIFTSYETYNYQVCTKYNPQYEQQTFCSVNYEKRANPDYVAPSPTTGDYACNGKKLADCIKQAAPTVSQYIYAPVGQTCNPVWIGRCETYENKTEVYPRFETKQETELTIYRFENDSFVKLDATLGKMVQKADALAFETSPLSVPGSITSRNQVQFQNGHLYVFADKALQTMAVAGNSVSYLERLEIASNTSNQPAIAFSSDRAMISAGDNSYPQTSSVTMLDLTTPSAPAVLTSFSMPGQTSQLILASGGILGPGTVSFDSGNAYRTLEKLTLFSRDAGSELDNLLVGTEYDALSSSYFDPTDDQRIRLGSNDTRLFLPYSGRRNADQYEPLAHRLNITRIENSKLVSEHSFAVSDDIVRTAEIDDARSLVFADSATYLIDRTSGDWALSTLRELFVPIATYRMNDGDLHARISRVGSKCRITTHAGDAKIFEEGTLAEAFVPCGEGSLPTGFGTNILFGDTRTGVVVSADGKAITPLLAADVAALLEKIPTGQCYLADAPSTAAGQPIDFLDAVPARILCEAGLKE